MCIDVPPESMVSAADAFKSKMRVRVRSVVYLAEKTLGFEFVALDGSSLPVFTAGSHIDVHLPGGLIRQYSISSDPAEAHHYVVAVLLEAAGRGGSVAMHEHIRPGADVTISTPRNHFAIDPKASHHLLIGAGIGITPMMAMVAELTHRDASFHLYYCSRSPERTAFLPEVSALADKGLATLVHDHGVPADGLDLKATLANIREGSALYYCGPGGFLGAVEAAASHWPKAALHSERFGAQTGDVQPPVTIEDDHSFDIKLASTGETFHVERSQTIVDVLRKHDINVDVSCEEGYCGTCMTRYLGGDPAHHDTVLDEEDREEFLMICCARARKKDDCLILDL